MELTFEQLPKAVTQIHEKLENIERLLLQKGNETPQEKDCWFDLTDLCSYLPDKPVKPTVYGWVHQRAIPNHRKGKKLYFLKSEIDEWLKAGRKKTVTEIELEAQNHLRKKRT